VESFEKRERLGFINVLIDNSQGTEEIKVDFILSFALEDEKGKLAQIDISTKGDYPTPDGKVGVGEKLRGTLVYDLTGLGGELTLFYARDLSQGYVRVALE
jgi:hypothetical protein